MYRVRLQHFEGPLDLLLFFIRRDELDIYDIPIARIADEFLDYVRLLQEVDLDVAGDFVYFASLLLNIKTRMLLPSTAVDEDGEPVDPRTELVERLLEYIRFKEASENLVRLEDQRADQFTRGSGAHVSLDGLLEPAEELVDATVFDLVSALRRVLTEDREEVIHEVHAESFTLEEQILYLRAALSIRDRPSFVDLMTGKSRPFIITSFLAVLEMARMQEIDIYIAGAPDDFHIALKKDADETPRSEADQNALDADPAVPTRLNQELS